MAIIKQDWTQSEVSLTVTALDSLADDGKAVLEVDNSTLKHLADDYDVELAGAGTGTVEIYRAGANVSANFAASTDILDVWVFVKSLPMSATKKKVDFRLEQLKKYNALLFVNNSGAALASTGNSVKRQGADLSNG